MLFSLIRPIGGLFFGLTIVAVNAQAATGPQDEVSGPGLVVRTLGKVTEAVVDSAIEARKDGFWRVAYSPWAPHFRYSDEHRYVWAVAAEREAPNHVLFGLSFFRNSFGQPSGYGYIGKRFTDVVHSAPEFYLQASLGVLYGYKGKFKDKVPLNFGGFSPGALIGAGWQFDRHASLTVHMLGDAAMMFQLAWDFR